jgi:hypothetical protein
VTCFSVRKQLSALRDDELAAAERRQVAEHLADCPVCAAHSDALGRALDALAELPRLQSRERIAPQVMTRLEVESRGVGLPLLFRPRAAARPFMLPALVPAVLVLLVVLVTAVRLDRDPRALAEAQWRERAASRRGVPAWGTEANPAVPSVGVSVPRARDGDGISAQLLVGMDEGSLFLETVIARDGSVSAVTLLDGDFEQAAPLIDALRHERFEPGRFRGRPVAVSLYRLISRMDVRVPST